MKKAVLINVGYDSPRYDEHLPIAPSLGVLALGSYLAAHDVPVEVLDTQVDFGFGQTTAAQNLVCQRVARYLHQQADDIAWIGVSMLANTASGVVLAQEINALLPEIPVIFGGYFPTNSYRPLLEKYPSISAIVRGDGEAAALHISRCLDQGQPFLYDQTPNLAWRHDGQIRTNPVRPMALDDLPIFDFTLLHNRSCYQLINVITSRGCPFRCNFCLESSMRPYAEYPVDWVTRQLDHLEAELSCMQVGISDPIFGLTRKRTLDMCQAMRGRRYNYGIESRVDVLAPDLLPSLRQVGLEFVFFGIESASPATLVRMNKAKSEAEAHAYVQDTLTILKTCFENGIIPLMGFMLDFPGDTEADCQITLEFVKEAARIRDQVAAETGVDTGFLPFSQPTKIYDGSVLAERIERDIPQAVLAPDPFEGEKSVISPSTGVEMEVPHRYEEEINNMGYYTPQVLDLINHYSYFQSGLFVSEHPELTDDKGVTLLADSVLHFIPPG
jgi:anaerobic magnesium-protoporphyrin IX monomethyl ester cyclase